MKLPRMPAYWYGREITANEKVLTIQQSEDYARLCVNEALERAATLCESMREEELEQSLHIRGGYACAAAIRSMAKQ